MIVIAPEIRETIRKAKEKGKTGYLKRGDQVGRKLAENQVCMARKRVDSLVERRKDIESLSDTKTFELVKKKTIRGSQTEEIEK